MVNWTQKFINKNTGVQDKYIFPVLAVLTVITAVIIRFKYLFTETITSDDALYAWQAQNFFHHPLQAFSAEMVQFHPPLFSALLSIGYFFPDPELAVRAVSMIFNILGIIAVYILGRNIGSRFVGLFAAIGLAFNINYLEISAHILIDDTLIFFLSILAITLMYADKYSPKINFWIIGLMGSLTILLKWAGVIAIPFIVAVYLIAFRELDLREKVRRMYFPLSLMLLTVGSLFINNLLQLGHVFPDLSAFQGITSSLPFWEYTLHLHEIMDLPLACILFLIAGLIAIFLKKEKNALIVGLMFIILFIGISIIPEKHARYGLMILPSGLLITALGIEQTLKIVFKNKNTCLFASLLCLLWLAGHFYQSFPSTDTALSYRTNAQVGYREAGDLVNKIHKPGGIILAGSPRRIRYYSGLNFQEFGGPVRKIPLHKIDFEKLMVNKSRPVILVIDVWEFTQPDWVYPFDEEVSNYLSKNGFHLVLPVKKNIMLPGRGRVKVPVVWIFSNF